MALGSAQPLTELDVRHWLRDNDPELNVLLDDYEFSSADITMAMTRCQDYWNETPPFLAPMSYTETPFRFHLLQGTAAQLLFSAAHLMRRNALPFTAGGIAVQDKDRWKDYEQAGISLWKQYREWVDRAKLTLNINQGWGYA